MKDKQIGLYLYKEILFGSNKDVGVGGFKCLLPVSSGYVYVCVSVKCVLWGDSSCQGTDDDEISTSFH